MPSLLAVIPHPDDESYSFGGLVALAADAGWRCEVVCASSGEGGKRYDGGAHGGEALAAAREAELAASCGLLGAAPPRFWRLADGHLRDTPDLLGRCRAELAGGQLELILTLGRDGAYGHPDHLAVHAAVDAAWRMMPAPRPPLLLAAFPRGLFLPQYVLCIGMMGDPPSPAAAEIGGDAFDLVLDVSPVGARKLAAIASHRTQLPGADPHALFPGDIVSQLLQVERFQLAEPADLPRVRQLLHAWLETES